MKAYPHKDNQSCISTQRHEEIILLVILPTKTRKYILHKVIIEAIPP